MRNKNTVHFFFQLLLVVVLGLVFTNSTTAEAGVKTDNPLIVNSQTQNEKRCVTADVFLENPSQIDTIYILVERVFLPQYQEQKRSENTTQLQETFTKNLNAKSLITERAFYGRLSEKSSAQRTRNYYPFGMEIQELEF